VALPGSRGDLPLARIVCGVEVHYVKRAHPVDLHDSLDLGPGVVRHSRGQVNKARRRQRLERCAVKFIAGGNGESERQLRSKAWQVSWQVLSVAGLQGRYSGAAISSIRIATRLSGWRILPANGQGHSTDESRQRRQCRAASPGSFHDRTRTIEVVVSLDRNRRELRRGADAIAVEPQIFDLLVYLIENRDRVVSRDDFVQLSLMRLSDAASLSPWHLPYAAAGTRSSLARFISAVIRRVLPLGGSARHRPRAMSQAARALIGRSRSRTD